MSATILSTILPLAPVFLLILIGQGLKRWRFVEDGFWPAAEKFTYYVAFPALLLASTAKADLTALPWGPVALASAGATLATAALYLLTRPLIGGSDAAFSSGFQGAIRPNTYVGLAGAATLYGSAGVAVTAICVAVVVPLVNVLAVAALTRYGSSATPPTNTPGNRRRLAATVRATARGIVTNPLILACLGGIGLAAGGVGLPPVIGPLLEILGQAALPLGLLAVGAGLSLATLRGGLPPLAAAGLLKLAGLPLLAWAGAGALGLDPASSGAVVFYAGLPCSASSYVLARQMGGDAPLMANIITVQTIAAMATLPLLLLILG